MIKTKTQLIVRLRPDSDLSAGRLELEWLWGTREGSEGDLYTGSLSELSQWWQELPLEEQDLPIVLLVSGFLSSSHLIHLNENQRKHWQQALPYLLEEQLASDVDSQHLVPVLAADDTVYTSCISNDVMADILQMFKGVELDPVKVVAETQLLQGKGGELTIWLEGNHAFVAAQDGFAQWLDSDALEVVVPGLLEEEVTDNLIQEDEEEEPSHPVITGVTVYGDDSCAETVARLETLAGQDVPVQCESRSEHSLLPSLASQLTVFTQKRRLMDFRTGAFKCTRRASRRWRQWRPVAIAAGLWLTVEVLFNAGSAFYFQYQAEALRDENFATYKELRPDDRRVVDVRHNLTRFLRDSTQQQSSPDFLNMLKAISSISESEIGKNIVPKNMDFNDANGRLSLDVQADSFDILNRYVQELKAAGLNARMENGNQDAKGVSARVIVRKA